MTEWKEIKTDGLPENHCLCLGAFNCDHNIIRCIYENEMQKFLLDDGHNNYNLTPIDIDFYLEITEPKRHKEDQL